MTAHRALRMAALAALLIGAVALGFGAVRASVALDQRFQETRYMVDGLRRCPLGRASAWTSDLAVQC